MRFTIVTGETTEHVAYYNQVFLRIIDRERAQASNHYEVMLPLKPTDVTFLNNKSAAMKRLQFSKRMFFRGKLFQEMCKAFIDNMLEKGYASETENEQIRKI